MLTAIAPSLGSLRWCLGLLAIISLFSKSAIAQVISDNTLGPESSQVTPTGLTGLVIRGGAQHQENLFHSFEQFNVNEGQRVTFENPDDVLRVFGRVTGGLPSDILGTLSSTGEADLFLLNPNGVVFGPNAQLNLGGSLTVSTAEAIEFGQLGSFGTERLEVSAPMLTVQPSAFLFGRSPGSISASAPADSVSSLPNLSVSDGERLIFLGGDVAVSGRRLSAPGGRIELGAMGGQTTIPLTTEGGLVLTNGIAQGDIVLSNGAALNVRADGGGDISLVGQNVTVEDSELSAGFEVALGTVERQSGSLSLRATEDVTIRNSRVENTAGNGSAGTSGPIQIESGTLQLLAGSRIFSESGGEQDAGDISLQVDDFIQIEQSAITADVFGAGNAADINITTGQLIGRAATIDSISFAVIIIPPTEGPDLPPLEEPGLLPPVDGPIGGLVDDSFGDPIDDPFDDSFGDLIDDPFGGPMDGPIDGPIDGPGDFPPPPIPSEPTGRTANISITADEALRLTDRSTIQSSSFFNSEVGSISLNSPAIELDNTTVTTFGGLGGQLSVEGESIRLSNRSFLSTADLLPFETSQISIDTASLEILGGSQVTSQSSGQGDAGRIVVTASEFVRVSGGETIPNLDPGQRIPLFSPSGIVSSTGIPTPDDPLLENAIDTTVVEDGRGGDIVIISPLVEVLGGAEINSRTVAAGDAGDIVIDTQRLNVLGGGSLTAETRGAGDAGDIVVTASEAVQFAGQTEPLVFGDLGLPLADDFATVSISGATSATAAGTSGEGGDIRIRTPILSIAEGAQLSSSTQGRGNAGEIEVAAGDRISLNNGRILATSTNENGRGGNMRFQTPFLVLTDQSEVLTQTAASNGGNIELALSEALILAGNSTVSAEAGTEQRGGNGGDITINTRFIVSTLEDNNDIVADAFDGNGGNVNIAATNGIFGIAARDTRTTRSDITASSQNGVSGDIDIETPDVDPSQGTVELPVVLAGPTVVQSCRERLVQSGSEFVISGRGGLPQSPLDATATTLWQDLLPIEGVGQGSLENSETLEGGVSQGIEADGSIVEAQGWEKNERGELVLVAAEASQSVGIPLSHCEG